MFAGQSVKVGPNQALLINEFDKKNRFYKKFLAEAGVRALAAKHPNSYHIALFACNKEKGKKIRAKFISADDALDDYWVKKGRVCV